MFCCFKPKYYTSGVSLNSKPSTECNIENISVSVTDRNTLYDPNEWLNTVNKTIDVKDTMPFIPPIEKFDFTEMVLLASGAKPLTSTIPLSSAI